MRDAAKLMPRRTIFAVLAAILCLPLPAFAKEAPVNSQLKGNALRDWFSAKTAISGSRAFIGIKEQLFAEHHNSNGTTDYKEPGVPTAAGQWSLEGDDKICYKYPGIDELNGTHCFFVFYGGNGCYYNFGRRAMSPSGPRNWDAWTSRFVIKGEGGTCGAWVG